MQLVSSANAIRFICKYNSFHLQMLLFLYRFAQIYCLIGMCLVLVSHEGIKKIAVSHMLHWLAIIRCFSHLLFLSAGAWL